MLDRRQLGVQARRERIVAAARTRTEEDGTEPSMRQLASDAGLSVATLYNLFGGKESILVAVLEPEIDALDARLTAEPPGHALERASAVVEASLDRFIRRGRLFRPLLGAIERQSASSARTAMMDRCAALIASAIQEAAARGDLQRDVPADLVARQIMWGYVQAIRYWASGDLSNAGFRAQVRSVLALGLLAVAGGSTRAALASTVAELTPTLRAISGR